VPRNVAPDVAKLRARVGALVICDAPPEVIEAARVELAAAVWQARIRRMIAAAPPVSDELRAELAELIRGAA
jgi:hypothetical protein